jgi:hypothetical protein
MTPDLTCIHSPAGLCESCREDYDADPSAWVEFGNHNEGLRRWRELQAEIAADRRDAPPEPKE